MKIALCSSLVLRSPDFNHEFIMHLIAVGTILSQLAVFNRKLLPAEEKYSMIGKECLAIKLAVQAFCVHLLGKLFVMQTDHRSLEWLDRLKENKY